MVMPCFYREQKTTNVVLWKNISEDHGKKLNLLLQGVSPTFKEEYHYINNMGFPVSTMNSTGVRIEHNSINSLEIPKGFIIIFKYKIPANEIEKFRNFTFNIPKETTNQVLKLLVLDFNAFYARKRNGLSSFASEYNFDFVMYVPAEELAGTDTVYIPECNLTLSNNSFLKLPNNPTLAMRLKQKPIRVYACDEIKDNIRTATTVQSVARDHLPDKYFYYLGREVCLTEAVKRENAEEGVIIITHFFNEENSRFNVSEKFIPQNQLLENGFFRTKQDLLTNGNPEEYLKLEIQNSRIELEKLKHKTELDKVKLENEKLKIRHVELKTESVKVGIEHNRQDYERLKHNDRVKLLNLESQVNSEKLNNDLARERISFEAFATTTKIKVASLIYSSDIEKYKTENKLNYEIESFNLSLENQMLKADIERQSMQRKNTEEGLKTFNLLGSIINKFI